MIPLHTAWAVLTFEPGIYLQALLKTAQVSLLDLGEPLSSLSQAVPFLTPATV